MAKGLSSYDRNQERTIPVFIVRFTSIGGKPAVASYLNRKTAEALKTNLERNPARGPVTIDESLQTQWFVDNMVIE